MHPCVAQAQLRRALLLGSHGRVRAAAAALRARARCLIATRLLTWQAAACALQAAVRCAAHSNKPGCVAAARALQAAARARCSAAALRRGGGKGADVDGRYACTGSPVDVACCGGWAVETACGSWGVAHAMTASSSTPVPAPHDSCPPPWSSPSSQRVKAPSESNGSLASQTPIAPHAAACLLLDDSTLALTPRCETLNPKPSLNPRPYSPYPQASTLRPLGLTLGCQWNTSVHICSSDVLLLLYATAAVYAHVCVCVCVCVCSQICTAAVCDGCCTCVLLTPWRECSAAPSTCCIERALLASGEPRPECRCLHLTVAMCDVWRMLHTYIHM